MPSYFPKALLFKEWRLGRWYLALGILLFSLGPLLSFVSTLSLSQAFIRQSPLIIEQNIMNINLPGLGFLLIIFSVGLALVNLSEFFRSTGIQLASEPIFLKSVLLTKFVMGIGIIVLSQTVTSLWMAGALGLRHAAGPVSTLYGWWLICTVMELSFYSVTFVVVLVVRPVVIGLLLMCAIVVAPLYAAEWFLRPWKHYLPGGGYEMNIPGWGLNTYNAIQDISPYGIIHYGMDRMMNSPGYFTMHALEPFGWTILAVLAVLRIGSSRISVVESFSPSIIEQSGRRRTLAVVRATSTLCAAVIAEHYVLHTNIKSPETKAIAILFLWLCCHWLVRAFIGYRQTVRRDKAMRWEFGSARGGTRG